MNREDLIARFRTVRSTTERLMRALLPEDFRCQSMPDVSPPYWTLGHTSWFFLANVLRPQRLDVDGFAGFDFTFNSYYEGLGPRLPRAQRLLVAQPSTDSVWSYRRTIDAAMLELLAVATDHDLAEIAKIVTIGIEHEQQHQELFLTEILHIRWSAPTELRQAYAAASAKRTHEPSPAALRPIAFAKASSQLGHQGEGFCWDNELPAHATLVGDFALGDRLITNAEWQAFVDDGGYQRPLLWLSNGWQAVQQRGWQAPLYWQRIDEHWHRFTLRGLVAVHPDDPVCHVSFYEADAFARWYGEQFSAWQHARLPRESEWEHAARHSGAEREPANLLDDGTNGELGANALDVLPTSDRRGLRQMLGDAWEWTQSHYEPYPGYRPFPGALMEYNGKFMDNQRVLRGGSFATPRSQARLAYRNFWPPETRFQATSVRLLRDA